ncbi:protein FAM83H-like isoform X1 [Anguilla anguilla]|uniref:protein FAM83H-like isoform X1 n=1 Tax=Anguilla anguilla TaxID=7936 RepID=UPI0015A768C9|nr:protein FAM83H-like isoform X1 [Anguilla anguilla]
MARRSQCSSQGDNPLDPHYLPPHYREEYRLAVDALVEEDLQGYYEFLQSADVVDFLCPPEVDHIRRSVQLPSQNIPPALPYLEAGDNASSDTYWPLHSDLEAPSLDLGWPDHHSFLGPTEVTMLVNPSDPNMPSIKEQARRLISNAEQVIGVVMDMFTDVDIFADLLDAAMRNVAVYILLDELNAHYFSAMVASCKVNLEKIPLMRIRTVSGTTYFCRTGKSFKGQMMDRFLLVDCKAVLSGNYSFMWSFEKIHRCIAHLFLGELVTTYDEEFRILYAQSQALVTESALVPLPGESGYSSHMTQSFRDHLPMQSSCYASNLRQPFGDKMDIEYNMLPFRRGEPFCSPLEASQMQMYSNVHPSKHLRMEQSFMEQGRSMMTSKKMEMALKRHSYAEGSHDSYGSSQQSSRHRVMNNLEESTHLYKEQHYYHEVGSGSGHGINYNIKSQGYNRTDQYFDSGYPLEMEPPGAYSHRADYLCSSPSKDIIHDSANHDNNPQSMSQPYICQASPTPLHQPDLSAVMTEASHNRQPQDPGTKQGLRKWRINSFLSTLEDDEEALTEPLGPDAFDELPRFSEAKLCTPEPSVVKFNTEEFPRISTSKQELIQQYSWSNQPEEQKHPSGKHAAMATDSKVMPEASESSTATKDDKAGEMEVREPREISITKQESFRSRVNPLLQRSSRLRSSLIFSSCNLEQNSSTMITASGLECKENRIEEENDHFKKSSVVAQILDKNLSATRKQFDWSSHRKTAVNENKNQMLKEELSSENVIKDPNKEPKLAEIAEPKDDQNMACDKELYKCGTNTDKHEIEKASRHDASSMGLTDPVKSMQTKPLNWSSDNRTAVHEATNQKSEESTEESSVKAPDNPLPKEKLAEMAQCKLPQAEKPIITAATEPLPIIPSFINMDDPEMRFLYFKRLAAERKAAKLSKESAVAGPDLPENVTDTSLKTPDISQSLANTNMKMKDSSVIGKVPAAQETTQDPTETHTEKHEIEKISSHIATNKSLQSNTFNSSSRNVTAVHEATNQKSEESTEESSEQSPKDPLPKDKSKLAELEQLKLSPKGKPKIITAPTELLPVTPSFINMDDPEMRFLYFKQLAAERKAAKLSKESAIGGPDLPENVTGTTLKMPSISENLADTNKMTDISAMRKEPAVQEATQNPTKTLINEPSISTTSAEPISKKPEISVAPQLENQISAVIHPARPDLQYKNSQPPADVPVATNRSPKLFEKDISKPPEDSQSLNISCAMKIHQNASDAEKHEIKNASGQSATSKTLTDPRKSLQNKPFNLSSDNGTVSHEATDQKSKESTSEKSPKDYLPKEESKLAEMASETSKLSVARALDLSENITDSSLKTEDITLNLTDTNMKMTDISVIEKEPASQEATQSQIETLIDKPLTSVTPVDPISHMPEDKNIHRDATDTEKHDIKIASGHSTTSMALTDPGKPLKNKPDSNSNLSLTGSNSEVKQDVKAMEMHTQNPRGVIGTLGNEKLAEVVAEDKTVSETVCPLPEACEKAPCLESQSHTEAKQATELVVTKSKEEKADHRPQSSATNKASQSLYQTSTNSVIYSCNLRDDTKVILEQISANSQNRVDLAKKDEGSTDDAKMGKDERSADIEGRPSKPQQGGTKFRHTPVDPQERENLLKKMEKMRKEKKIYSRFEMGS